jgi:hypothetical protein
VPLVALGLLAALIAAKQLSDWPGPSSDNLLLIGVLILSLLPVVLVLVDVVAQQGGAIAFREVRIDFAGAVAPTSSITIPRALGLPGVPVSDSTTTQIIDTLRNAAGTEIVVVDLEEGDAWWETRLLVLCAGATRMGRPRAIVFLATKGTPQQFQGWAPPAELLRALLRAEQGYRVSYATAQAAAAQWAVVPPPPSGAPCPPPPLQWFTGPAVTQSWMAWRQRPSGCERNELTFEQFLANEIGHYEPPEAGGVTIVRLQQLFDSVLRTTTIDQQWSDQARLDALLAVDDEYVAVTNRGQYVGLLSRSAGHAAILAALVDQSGDRGRG